jgi:hypothetical protein
MTSSPTDDGFTVSPAGDTKQQECRDRFARLLRLQATVNAVRRGSKSSLDEADFGDAYDFLVRKRAKERLAKCFGSGGIAIGGLVAGCSYKLFDVGPPAGMAALLAGACLLAAGIYIRDFMEHK